MDISFSAIMASIIFSGAGLWVFKVGRSRTNNYLIVIGLLLMIYTYFTSNAWIDWSCGIALCLAARYYWDQ